MPAEVEKLGPYLLLEPLAPHGMIQPYVARREDAEALVIVKRLLPQLRRHSTAPRRFAREARLTRHLQSPVIVRTLDVGVNDGELFMVTELVAGVRLDVLMTDAVERGHPLPIDVVFGIAQRALAALAYAHEAVGADGRPLGLVHRDLTPSSVVVGFSGEVKLGDFGVARSQWDTALTAPGTTVGTLAYMSPEQVSQGPVGPATDLYGFSVVLYELLAGAPLIEAQDALSVLRRIKDAAFVPLGERRPDLPRSISAVVQRGLATAPKDRWPDARAYATALREALQSAAPCASTERLGAFVQARLPDQGARFQALLDRMGLPVHRVPGGASTGPGSRSPGPRSSMASGDDRPPPWPSAPAALNRRGGPGEANPLQLYGAAPLSSSHAPGPLGDADEPPVEPTPEPSVMTMPGPALAPAGPVRVIRPRSSKLKRIWRLAALTVAMAGVVTAAAWWTLAEPESGPRVVVINPEPSMLTSTDADMTAADTPRSEGRGGQGAIPVARSAGSPDRPAPAVSPRREALDRALDRADSAKGLDGDDRPAGRRIVRSLEASPDVSAAPRDAPLAARLLEFSQRLNALRQAESDARAFDALLLDMKRTASLVDPAVQRAVMRDLQAAERAFDVDGLAQALRRLQRYATR